MPKKSSAFLVGVLSLAVATGVTGLGTLAVSTTAAVAQNRTAPAGSSLALTPPIDQRRKQYRALPKTQRKFYKLQGYKKYRPPN